MHISIEGVDYVLPASLREITLGDRIAYDKQYGQELNKKLKALIEMEDGLEKELSTIEYHCELACKNVSFFGKIPLDIVEQAEIDTVLFLYQESLKDLTQEVDFTDEAFQLQNEFEWNGTLWTIAAPELNSNSRMSFGEFLDAKQQVKNLSELGEDNWEALLYLACVYFRKKDEPYKEVLSAEGGERYQLLQTLPLDLALHVGFFFLDSTTSYLKTFRSSGQAEASQPEGLSVSI